MLLWLLESLAIRGKLVALSRWCPTWRRARGSESAPTGRGALLRLGGNLATVSRSLLFCRSPPARTDRPGAARQLTVMVANAAMPPTNSATSFTPSSTT